MSRTVNLNGRSVRVSGRTAVVGSAIPDSDVYYKIDEGSGSTLANENGDSTYNATLTGTPNWNEGADAHHGRYVIVNENDRIEVDNTDGGQLIDFNSDFSIGVEVFVDSSGLSDNATIWEYSDGNKSMFCTKIGTDTLLSGYYNGSSRLGQYQATTPSPPYQANFFVQFDASTKETTLFVNEVEGSPSSGSGGFGLRDDPLTFGVDTSGNNNGPMNQGISAIAIWKSIVNPSKFVI